MDPIAPFAKIAEWGSVPTIAWAVILGVAFGFVLERAGFGNARTLAGQWYGYNFAVLRVMFTAIVVAMLGLFGLNAIGFIDVGRVQLNETFLVPQVVGGFIFGAGFAIGQYCPGTAVVACSTGRLDAMTYFLGFFAGVVAFVFTFPVMDDFYSSTGMGRVTVADGLGIPLGVVVVLVVVMALGAFAVTEVLDRKFGNKAPGKA